MLRSRLARFFGTAAAAAVMGTLCLTAPVAAAEAPGGVALAGSSAPAGISTCRKTYTDNGWGAQPCVWSYQNGLFYAYGGLVKHPSNCATWKIIGYDENENPIKSTALWPCSETNIETPIFSVGGGLLVRSRLKAYDGDGKEILAIESPLLP